MVLTEKCTRTWWERRRSLGSGQVSGHTGVTPGLGEGMGRSPWWAEGSWGLLLAFLSVHTPFLRHIDLRVNGTPSERDRTVRIWVHKSSQEAGPPENAISQSHHCRDQPLGQRLKPEGNGLVKVQAARGCSGQPPREPSPPLFSRVWDWQAQS